jgi:hypothetical protein
MLYGTSKRLSNETPVSVTLNGSELETVEQYKYLGLLFDQTLSWEKHAEVMHSKISKRIGVFRRVRSYLDRKTAEMMYNALILPLFDYCDIVVGNGNYGIITRLQKLQNRGGRAILGWNRFTHSIDILNELKWLSIEERVKLHTGVMMYKCHRRECPRYLYESVSYSQNREGAITRGAAAELPTPNAFTLVSGQKSFTYQGPKIVLSLDFNILECQSLNVFKTKMTHYLVNTRM